MPRTEEKDGGGTFNVRIKRYGQSGGVPHTETWEGIYGIRRSESTGHDSLKLYLLPDTFKAYEHPYWTEDEETDIDLGYIRGSDNHLYHPPEAVDEAPSDLHQLQVAEVFVRRAYIDTVTFSE